MEPRPKIKIELTTTDKLIELLGWLVVIALCVLTIGCYINLPETIPIHFNARGKADSYGDRIAILVLPGIALIIFAAMTILNNYPHIFNYPVKITPENALKQYTNSTRVIRYMKMIVPLIFLIIVISTMDVANDRSDGLGTWFLPVALALVFIPLIFFTIKAVRNKK